MLNGNFITELRREKNLSREELAKIVGVSRATINNIESGKVKNPRSETLFKIAYYFNKDINELFFCHLCKIY